MPINMNADGGIAPRS